MYLKTCSEGQKIAVFLHRFEKKKSQNVLLKYRKLKVCQIRTTPIGSKH